MKLSTQAFACSDRHSIFEMFLGCHDCQVMAYYPLHFVSSAIFAPMHLDKKSDKSAAQVGQKNGTCEGRDPENSFDGIWGSFGQRGNSMLPGTWSPLERCWTSPCSRWGKNSEIQWTSHSSLVGIHFQDWLHVIWFYSDGLVSILLCIVT